MLRLKANKTSLYNLVATYKPLPGMRRVDFKKANGRPDYWLEWTTDDGHTKAFLSSSLGHPILTITTHDAAGGQLYLVMYQNPQGCFTAPSGKTVPPKEAMDKLDRMAQSLGELIDREDTLLRNILESDRKRK